MRHKIGYNALGRKAAHRKALIRNLMIQLFRHERIRTTKAKALEARKKAEKLITRAKEDTLHNRRTVSKLIHDREILAKLFDDIGKRFLERQGGYTRILKLGFRQGDAAEMVLLELVDSNIEKKKKKPPVQKVAEVPAEIEDSETEEVKSAAEKEESVPQEKADQDTQEDAAEKEPDESQEEPEAVPEEK